MISALNDSLMGDAFNGSKTNAPSRPKRCVGLVVTPRHCWTSQQWHTTRQFMPEKHKFKQKSLELNYLLRCNVSLPTVSPPWPAQYIALLHIRVIHLLNPMDANRRAVGWVVLSANCFVLIRFSADRFTHRQRVTQKMGASTHPTTAGQASSGTQLINSCLNVQ